MGFFTELARPSYGATYPADHDFWYTEFGTQSQTGVRVSAQTVMKISAVWACVRVISETLASIPLVVYVDDV